MQRSRHSPLLHSFIKLVAKAAALALSFKRQGAVHLRLWCNSEGMIERKGWSLGGIGLTNLRYKDGCAQLSSFGKQGEPTDLSYESLFRSC